MWFPFCICNTCLYSLKLNTHKKMHNIKMHFDDLSHHLPVLLFGFCWWIFFYYVYFWLKWSPSNYVHSFQHRCKGRREKSKFRTLCCTGERILAKKNYYIDAFNDLNKVSMTFGELFSAPLQALNLEVVPVIGRNQEVNLTAIILPKNPNLTVFYWWIGNNLQVHEWLWLTLFLISFQ